MGIIFILPFFLSPFNATPVEVAKRGLLGVGALIVFAIWLLSRLEKGSIALPKTLITGSLIYIPVVATLSALLSGQLAHSFFGLGFETSTAIALILWAVVAFLSSLYFRQESKISLVVRFLLIGQIISFVVFLLHFAMPDFLGAILRSPIDTLIGKWNDFGLYSGLTALLSLLVIELRSVRVSRILAWVTLVTSSIVLILVNLELSWYLVGAGALGLVVYSVLGKSRDSYAGFNAATLATAQAALFVVAAIFVLFGGTKSDGSQQALSRAITSFENNHGIISIEARPSRAATLGVVQAVSNKALLLGVGPNNFSNEWRLSKPDEVNESIFWDADFFGGYGYVLTQFVNTGLLGMIGWVLLMIGVASLGIRGLYMLGRTSDRFDHLLVTVVGAFYLWGAAFLYLPDNALLALTFVFTGMLVGFLSDAGVVSSSHLHFAAATRARFVGVLATIVLVLSSLAGSYVLAKKLYAFGLFQEGLTVLSSVSNADQAASLFSQAADVSAEDLYYRALSQVTIIQFSKVLTQTNIPKETAQAQFAALFKKAYDYADTAVKLNPDSSDNYIALGKVYESVVPLNVTGSFDAASKAYRSALEKNPKSPSIYLNLARLEFSAGNTAKARSYVTQGLAKKSNYAELIFLSSQIEAKDGNLARATTAAEQAALLAPNDIGVWFQVGALKYANKDYKGSGQALAQAVALNPNYSNAHYFLGLVYEKLGDQANALAEFEKVLTLNPDNTEVKQIITNLKAGRGSFEASAPAVEAAKTTDTTKAPKR